VFGRVLFGILLGYKTISQRKLCLNTSTKKREKEGRRTVKLLILWAGKVKEIKVFDKASFYAHA